MASRHFLSQDAAPALPANVSAATTTTAEISFDTGTPSNQAVKTTERLFIEQCERLGAARAGRRVISLRKACGIEPGLIEMEGQNRNERGARRGGERGRPH